MEYLDIYNEQHVYLGKELRSIVHEKGLWHNTVHVWLYDLDGNIYFQIRKDENKLYTTASGHVDADEDLVSAVKREISEEIGLHINESDLEKIGIVKWQSKSIKDNKPFIDNAFAHVYLLKVNINNCHFIFQEDEVLDLAKLKAVDVLKLFRGQQSKIKAVINDTFEYVTEDDFLMDTDVFMNKYVFVLETIVGKMQ